MVQPGRYRHYQGHEYEVLGVALHSTMEEEYGSIARAYGNRELCIRPGAMFPETVLVDSHPCPRF